jgi:hypothetical protein
MSSALALSDLVAFQAKYSLLSGLSGSAHFTNQNLQYGSDLLWTTAYIEISNSVSSNLADDSAFHGTTAWINGIIHSVDDGCQIADNFFKFNIASFYSPLASKPISTHFYSAVAGTVLLDVLQVYCGVPVTIFSITAAAAPLVQAVVQGSNVWEECIKLAQCCHSDMFVQTGGLLVVEPWKDHNSAVDYVLPREAVFDVNRVRSTEKGPSRIRVRGREVSKFDCGPRLVSPDPTKVPNKLSREKCYRNGLGEPSSDIVLKNLGGSKGDLTNAGYILSGDLKFDTMDGADIKDASASIHTVPKTGTFLEAATDSEIDYKVLTRNKTGDTQNSTIPTPKFHKGQISVHDRALAKLAHAPPGVFTIANKDPQLGSQSGDRDRLEMVVNDTVLQAEFGIITDELDNQYISTGYGAFILGIRKVQEFLMGRNKYKLKTAYLPVLQINDVITFIVTNTDQELTGRIVDIDVNGDIASSKIGMSIEVECFNELAGRTYQSGNLLIYPELCGINQVNWVSAIGVYALSGYFGFESGASVYQPTFLGTGVSYTLTAELILVSPTGSFTVKDTSSGSSVTVSSSGVITLSYTPITVNSKLDFKSVSGEWFLTNPRLSTILTT